MRRSLPVNALIILLASIGALFLTIVRQSPEGLIEMGVGEREVRAAPGEPASSIRAKHNLTQLKIFNLTLVRVRDSYVEPDRIDPKKMLFAALDSVQFNIPEVLVEPFPDRDEVVVSVNDKQETFSTKDVDSPWRLSGQLKKIFRFIEANMNPGADLAEVEYAAVNGMLQTLDPHSMLLDPEAADDLDMQTTGKFGGLGIVIGTRNGKLTVIQPMPDTPASRAGVKACDHIVRINSDPTENLTTNEAANRMRGDAKTKVTIWIERKGEKDPIQLELERDYIKVPSVEYRMLDGKVGYMKAKSFAARTAKEVRDAMVELKAQGATSFILDLRWNPGGLFEPAVQLADLFVDSGTIVTQVGGKERDPRRASRGDSDLTSPLAVLVNSGSASASEIVAGALKHLDRAVLIGTTSFGKGSVQLVYDNNDGSKLKLTIAQYLTPGDISIQGNGITPDVELVRMDVPDKIEGPADRVRLLATTHVFREADYEAHLTHKSSVHGKPFDTLRYVYEQPAQPADVCAGDDDVPGAAAGADDGSDDLPPADGFVEDFEIRFARDFISQARSPDRKEILEASRKLIATRRAAEQKKLATKLATLGVDWTAPAQAPAGKPALTANVTLDKSGGQVKAGDQLTITGTVTNHGNAPAYQVLGEIRSDDRMFDETELAFGKVGPGETKTFTTHLQVPMDAVDRVDLLDVNIKDPAGDRAPVEPIKVAISAIDHPQFAYTHQLVDDGNGDGLVQLHEPMRLLLNVKNVGKGDARELTALLRNVSTDGDNVTIKKGRFELSGGLAAGAQTTFEFEVDVLPQFKDNDLVLEMTVYDSVLRESLVEKASFPIRPASAGPTPASGTVVATSDAQVLEGAAADATPLGVAHKGSSFAVTGTLGDYVRVNLGPGRPGFLASKEVKKAGRRAPTGTFEALWQVTPPLLTLNVPSHETSGPTYRLQGRAKDDTHIEDVFVYVSNRDAKIDGRKVFYKSNRGSKTPADLPFSIDIPLWPGNNLITVVARENDEVKSSHIMYLYRTDGQVAAQQASVEER